MKHLKDDMESKKKIRMSILVSGNMQRASYRRYVTQIARELGVTGYVDNLEGGSVSIVAECNRVVANRLMSMLNANHWSNLVEDLTYFESDALGEFDHFVMRYPLSELEDQIEILEGIIIGMQEKIVGEITHQIATLRQERLLLFEMNMLSNMYERFTRYDNDLSKLLEMSPYEKSVFIMMPFEKNDIRSIQITNTIKDTLNEYGLHGWRADDPEREVMDDIWDNIVVNMLSCKYGIAVFVDRRVLDRFTDREISVFNANIALEVGFMKSRGLEVLILKDKQLEKLPTDIISKLYEEFHFNNPERDVKIAVTKWVRKFQRGGSKK